MTLKHFGKALNASFIAGVACRHTVRDIQVTDDIHRNVDGLFIRLTGKRQGANTPLVVTGLQIDQHTGGQFVVRIVKRTQTRIQNAVW
ncbi:hypothetical protein D3C72_1964770 [compost metagenome]